jgi:hypothetical protein
MTALIGASDRPSPPSPPHLVEAPADRPETSGPIRSNGRDDGTGNEPQDIEGELQGAQAFVQRYLDMHQIEVLFDGSLALRGLPLQAVTPNDIDAVLEVEFPTLADLLDQIFLDSRPERPRLSRTELKAALNQIIRVAKRNRLSNVMKPLLEECPADERRRAHNQWRRLGTLFDMASDLAVAVLQHFVWSVKQKQLGRPVVHHCMPIIFSEAQGGGKSVFVKQFVAPLRELATDSALLSDFADSRSGDIFRFPVVLIDDMEEIRPSTVAILKSVMTSDRLRRRRLGSSMSYGIRQACMPIGTSNRPVEELVKDDTGHRRFVMMPFRNGSVVKGGSKDVWDTVNGTDYQLLWRSVSAFEKSPLYPYLKDLELHQSRAQKKDPLLQWLIGLDLKSEPVLNLTTKSGLKSDSLRSLFMAQSGEEIKQRQFSELMERYFSHPETPFGDKRKTDVAMLYVLKKKSPASSAPHLLPPLESAKHAPNASHPSDPAAPSDPSGVAAGSIH